MEENREEYLDITKFMDETLEKRLKEGRSYHDEMKFTENWPMYERFLASDQWPAPTRDTKNMPRPVFNVIEYIQNHKKSNVLNENIKMVYTSDEVQDVNMAIDDIGYSNNIALAMEGADKFTRFSETTWERLQQDKINDEVVSSAANIGAGFAHYYWDNNISGGIDTQFIGDFEGEFIDPANLFVGNPQCLKVQQQPWIIITKRESLDRIKEMAKNNSIPANVIAMIQGDKTTENELYDSAKHEIQGSDKVTLITMYYKKNGMVYFKKSVNSVIVQEETSTELKLYPIAAFIWKSRKKSFYGLGETEGLIPNQKNINYTMAMSMLSVQQTAWPKLLAKAGALTQNLTNTPGEVVIDNYMGQGEGIKYLSPGQFNPIALTMVDKFMDFTKTLNGANDASVGEAPGADMAAQAIMLLQKSASQPQENIKKRYYQYIEDVGRIQEDIYKVKYSTKRRVKVKDNDGQEYSEDFLGSNYAKFPMSLKIDVGPASQYSEYVSQNTLDRLFFESQQITLEEYLEFCPRSSIPFKNNLLKKVKDRLLAQAQMGMPPIPENIPPTGDIPTPNIGSMGINPVVDPSIQNVGTNNGKM